MAKKFMHVCFGALALMLAFHLGAQYGGADTIVDHTTAGIVAADLQSDRDAYVLLDNGEVWDWNEGNAEWSQHASSPIPVSQTKFWTWGLMIDADNQVWTESGGQWFNRGTPPGGVAAEPSTWGNIKAKWRDSDG